MDIRKIRERLRLSQNEFADMLGVSTQTIRRWQRGDKPKKTYKNYLEELNKKSMKEPEITPAMIKAIRKGSGLTREEFAKVLGTSLSALADWEAGRHAPRKAFQRKIYEYYKENR